MQQPAATVVVRLTILRPTLGCPACLQKRHLDDPEVLNTISGGLAGGSTTGTCKLVPILVLEGAIRQPSCDPAWPGLCVSIHGTRLYKPPAGCMPPGGTMPRCSGALGIILDCSLCTHAITSRAPSHPCPHVGVPDCKCHRCVPAWKYLIHCHLVTPCRRPHCHLCVPPGCPQNEASGAAPPASRTGVPQYWR